MLLVPFSIEDTVSQEFLRKV